MIAAHRCGPRPCPERRSSAMADDRSRMGTRICLSLPSPQNKGCPMSRFWDVGSREPLHSRCHPEPRSPQRPKSKDLHLLFVLYQGTTSVVPHPPTHFSRKQNARRSRAQTYAPARSLDRGNLADLSVPRMPSPFFSCAEQEGRAVLAFPHQSPASP